jgi:hypothetical protein
MNDIIAIDIPKSFKFSMTVENQLTHFFDKFNIERRLIDDETYRDLHNTYIDIDGCDVSSMLNNSIAATNFIVLAFRIVGATRGGIYLRELHRSTKIINNDIITSIEYEIFYVEFIENTCFKKFKAYSPDIISQTEKEIYGKKIIINIYK